MRCFHWLAACLLVAGCGRAAPTTDLHVFAAASLREPFEELAERYQQEHPGWKIVFHFAGSQELRTQIEHGAAADVFASADTKHMAALEDVHRVVGPQLFARNEPVMVVPAGSRLTAFAQLPEAQRIVLGTEDVPIGRYTQRILDKAGPDFKARVEGHVVSRELNVRQVLAKVSLGEADAAIVYRTDARAAGDEVSVVIIPAELNVIAEYPIAVVADSKQPTAARQWVELVMSPNGQGVLQVHGFLPQLSAIR